MFRNRLYYRVKPLLPWSVRMSVRRHFARRKRARVADVWPVNPGSEQPPAGWPGWPDGKQFAFVLTHDVEGPDGVAKVRQLADLEMTLGFRSCFNFIPEGPYRVPAELRAWLVANGFEVGVHDLRHDGNLFRNRQHFASQAARINTHLKAWGASGFRAGFMLSESEWLHDLDISYDCSTFDTDPFEPQPYGQNTIFPFWVHNPKLNPNHTPPAGSPAANSDLPSPNSGLPSSTSPRTGYVELPYTLPQDSTLFLLLRESSPAIWVRKLDWIARHGGMALLDTHPDYIQFPGETPSRRTYPAGHYAALLRHVREQHVGRYWHSQPREISAFMHASQSTGSRPLHRPARASRSRSASKPRIWVDLDNTPHVPFFEPILDELRMRGYPVLVTARDAFQVCDLADQKQLPYVKVGRHYGKNRFLKGAGLAYRAAQLAPLVMREKPVLAVSHGARSQLILGNCLRVPTLLIEDYEYCQFPPLMKPTWLMAPQVIPDASLCLRNGHVRKYPGIKEDVYAWKLKPDFAPLQQLGIQPADLLITVRPPATEAHYHNPESEELFTAFMHRACGHPEVRMILLPRNRKQADLIRHQWPGWFADDKTVIPSGALDGMNLIWHSDLVVSGGGTMNREAAALGVPVYSIFRGTIGAVDQHLSAAGRLTLVESSADVAHKISIVRRPRRTLAETTSRETLDYIVRTIIELAESYA